MNSTSRRLLRFFLILAIVYTIILVVLSLLENRIVYQPRSWPEGEDYVQPPGVRDVLLTTADGEVLHSWYLEHESPRGYLLFFHGNAGNLYGRLDRLLGLNQRHGLSVFALDYRGFGKSTGKPTEAHNLLDARLARAEFARLAGISEQEITILGRSLGGGVAVDLAAADGCRGLILESTFSSLPEVAKHFYWWLPVSLLMRNRYDSARKIGHYTGPLMQCHSEDDTVVPIAVGRRLFERANEPKTFHAWDGIDHNDSHPESYDDLLEAFFDQLELLDHLPAE